MAALAIASQVVRAEVRADEKTHVEFAGVLGRVVNIFGGKAAREGVSTTVAVKGDRKATMTENTGQIIDLAEEKVYDLDLRKKTYKVTTFDELRRRMEESRKRAEEDAARERSREEKQTKSEEPKKPEKEVEVDFNVKTTGEKKTINGFDTHEAVATITVREKGKTLEEGGGMVVTSDMWLAPKIAAMKEIADFDMRYAQKLYGSMMAGVSAEQMAAALAMYPMMKDAMSKMSAETGKLDGTPILTTVTMDTVKSNDDMQQQAKQQQDQQQSDDKSAAQGGVGGLFGKLASKAAAKKLGGGGDDANKQRATFLTSTTEVLKVATDVAPGDVAVPAGFKENK
jgi:hypothetical protein